LLAKKLANPKMEWLNSILLKRDISAMNSKRFRHLRMVKILNMKLLERFRVFEFLVVSV
jgi:hypothetical protein